ncbi:hypothetical protein E4U54_003399 [Claviceps lovelessii]|nr:hypothetical protein E4U54_003399 [Claviceps lovelessii]
MQDHNGRTASYHAVMRGKAHVVDVFLARGASVTIPDRYGSLPIHAAVQRQDASAPNLSSDEPVMDEFPGRFPGRFPGKSDDDDDDDDDDACWCDICTRSSVLGTDAYECPACDGGSFLSSSVQSAMPLAWAAVTVTTC